VGTLHLEEHFYIEFIQKAQQLSHLDLSYNRGCPNILPLLSPTLKHLCLNGMNFFQIHLNHLSRILDRLESLELENATFQPGVDFQGFYEAVKTSKTLKTLDLFNAEITFERLKYFQNIETLGLRGDKPLVFYPMHFRAVNLSNRPVDLKVFTLHASLQNLKLCHTFIQEDAMVSFFKDYVAPNRTLTSLDVSGWMFSDKKWPLILGKTVKRNTSLTFFAAHVPDVIHFCRKVCRHNTTLKDLEIMIEQKEMPQLKRIMAKMTHLEFCALQCNAILKETQTHKKKLQIFFHPLK
jgi:hypothetical protein